VDPRRLRHGEWIAGIAGGADAWNWFTVIDVLLAISGLWGVGLAVAAATQRTPAVPQTVSQLAAPFAFVAAVLVLIRLANLPGAADARELGLYLGVAGALGVLVGVWRSIGDESFPREVATQVEVTPLPAPKPRSEPASDE
jgi:hypothetical protein